MAKRDVFTVEISQYDDGTYQLKHIRHTDTNYDGVWVYDLIDKETVDKIIASVPMPKAPASCSECSQCSFFPVVQPDGNGILIYYCRYTGFNCEPDFENAIPEWCPKRGESL